MKIASSILLASIVLLNTLAVPLRAQTQAAEAETNKALAPASNDAAPKEDVRIDRTGIHVGGSEPVDINIPDWGSQVGPLIPIVAMVAVFGSPVAILGLFFYFRHRRNRMMHETLRAMIEKGVPIPPELLAGGGAALANAANAGLLQNNDLRYGLIFVALGIGLFVLVGKWGLIPLLIGAAMIVAWLIGKTSSKNPTPH